MIIDGFKLKNVYKEQGFNQTTLSAATQDVDPDGSGISKKTISRGCADGRLDELSLKLISKVLGKDPSYFNPDDPSPLDTHARAFVTSEFLLDLIDSGAIGRDYWEHTIGGECLWEFLRNKIRDERIRRHFSDSDFADGIERLMRSNTLVRLSDGSIRVVRPSAGEVLLVLDIRLGDEIRVIKQACKEPPEMRMQISNEQVATYEKCLELLDCQSFPELIITETSWHHAWCGNMSSMRRVMRSNMNLASQVGDSMLTSANGGPPICRTERFEEEFKTMLEELRQMNEVFSKNADFHTLRELITTHVSRSKRIINQMDHERRSLAMKVHG